MKLVLHIKFPFGRFHGQEFPPSPSRLFQALIASSHRGVYVRQNPEIRDRALEWLESVAPPVIESPPFCLSGVGATNYVPNNDNSSTHNRTAKPLRAFVLDEESKLRYCWQIPDDHRAKADADVICKLARLITHLGHGQDSVFVQGELTNDDSFNSTDGSITLKPKDQRGGGWTAPQAGALTAYKSRYDEFLRTRNAHSFTVPLRQLNYLPHDTIDLSCPYAFFELRELFDASKFVSFDGRDLRQAAAMVRHAVTEFFESDKGVKFKNYYGEELIVSKVYGHETRVMDQQPAPVGHPHLAFIPLPGLFPDGRIRRVVLAGFGFESERELELFDDIARNLNGMELKDNNAPIGRLLRVESRDKSWKFFQQFYGNAHRVWRSVTPIVASGFGRRGRKPEHFIYRALDHLNIEREAIESVAAFRGPLVPKTFRPLDYRIADRLASTPRYHAEIIFRRPVSGYLVLGRGRHAGFGLMQPIV